MLWHNHCRPICACCRANVRGMLLAPAGQASQASAIKQTRSTAFIGTVRENGHVCIMPASRQAGAPTRRRVCQSGHGWMAHGQSADQTVSWLGAGQREGTSGSRVVRLGFAAEIAGRQTKALTKGGRKIGLIAITAVAGNLLHRQCAFCQQPAGF